MASAIGEDPSPDSSLQMNMFDCSICLQMFTRPKVLPCGHTFCKDCLVKYVKGGRSFKCPTCNRNVNLKKDGSAGVEGLTDNISLKNLRDDFARLKVERQGRAPRGAEGLPSLSDDYVCDKHPGEALKFYCPVCEDAICEECMLSDHNTHGVMRLSKALEEQAGRARQEIKEGNGLVANVRGKIAALEEGRGRLDGEQNVQLHAIDEVVPKLKRAVRQAIEQRAAEVKEELKNMVLAEAAVLTNQTEELETLLAKFLNGVDEVERCISTGATIPLIRGRKVLREIIQSLQGGSSSDLSTCGTVVFTPVDMVPIPFGTVERVERAGGSRSASSSSPSPSTANGRPFPHLSVGMETDSDTDEDIDLEFSPNIPGTGGHTFSGRLPHSNGLRMNNPPAVNQQATSSTPIQSPLQYDVPAWLTATNGAPYSTQQVYSAATTIISASQMSQATTSPVQQYTYAGACSAQRPSSGSTLQYPHPSQTIPAQMRSPVLMPGSTSTVINTGALTGNEVPLFSPLPRSFPMPYPYPQMRPSMSPYTPAAAASGRQATNGQRARKIIKITDDTGRNVTDEILNGGSGTSSPTLPKSTDN
ncbi:uncharacterized protein [Branchiostoma lanceolatum]|uniref:uncharacterized protein n=1 Tax=Branchiostoma lanceolatum TaxID=7740 RepID=UPI0034519166